MSILNEKRSNDLAYRCNVPQGNDLVTEWSLWEDKDCTIPAVLDIAKVNVRLIGPSATEAKCSFTLEDNILRVYFLGKNQKRCGDYTIKLTENAGQIGMRTVDCEDVFTIVPHSSMAGGECKPNTNVITLALSSTFSTPAAGADAYEVAVAEGFVGTRKEWLASLKGEKGDPGKPGKDGCILYPTFEVDSEMHLIATADAATENMYIDENGHLIMEI